MTPQPDPSPGNWGRWGPDDERGTLNLLTPEVVLGALRTASSGRVFQLGSPIRPAGNPNVAYRPEPQRLTLNNRTDEAALAAYGGEPGTGSVEDVLIMGSHAVTHIDALSHIYTDGQLYNGFPVEEQTSLGGAPRCGIETTGPIVTRGVLVDVAGLRGVDCLDPGYVITDDDLSAALDAQGLEIQAGDAVLFRTGWLPQFLDRDGDVPGEQAGIGIDVARRLAAADVALVGADNTAVEAMPFDHGDFVTVHIELLVRHGIHLVEHLWLEELAAAGCDRFLFGLSPLPVVGATASPVNPFAVG